MEFRRTSEKRTGAPVGIATPDEMKARLYAAAKGQKAFDPNGPKVFMAPEAQLRLITRENLELLSAIKRDKPKSVSDLANKLGREQGNVSKSISKLVNAGWVTLLQDGREKRPEVIAERLQIQITISDNKMEVTAL